MSERPIIFSGPMVSAILAGAKTQTRRLVKPQPDQILANGAYWDIGGYRLRKGATNPLECPYGEPGDRLWVKETWGYREFDNGGDRCGRFLVYRADGVKAPSDNGAPKPWTPSTHMPRWASRITLEIASVHVERLNEISEEDADAEGADTPEVARIIQVAWSKRDAFAKLWSTIHAADGPNGWAANPWVWVVKFSVVDGRR